MMDMEAAGSLAAAGLVAHQIDADDGPVHAKGGHHATTCLNCDSALSGEFCHTCGQRAHVHKSLLHLGEEVLHGLLHFDAKGWRTLPMLVLHPGQLTRRYIDGHRTRFVSPLALFLFMVFLMFFVASLTSGTSDLSLSHAPSAMAEAKRDLNRDRSATLKEFATAEALLEKAKADGADVEQAQSELDQARTAATVNKMVKVFNATGKAATSDKVKVSSDLSVTTGWPEADAAIKHAIANPEFTLYKLKSSGSKLSFLLVPITLPFLWLLFFWKRGVTMYDHAVFSLYSLSFMSLMFVVVFLLNFVGLSSVLPYLICCAPPLHMFVQLRGTYGLNRKQALWRTFALLCISATVFALYLMLILIMSMR